MKIHYKMDLEGKNCMQSEGGPWESGALYPVIWAESYDQGWGLVKPQMCLPSPSFLGSTLEMQDPT